MQPLISTILDLDHALGGNARLIIGGGLGLYLKQQHLQASGTRTLLEMRRLPAARATKDIDLFLRADVVAQASRFERVREALGSLAFRPVEAAKYVAFHKTLAGVEIVIDIMTGPAAERTEGIRIDGERARPREQNPKIELHARYTPDALGIERHAAAFPIAGIRASDARSSSCVILIPCSFTYALMKLGALDDRMDDRNKNEGRHHAMDLYRVVGLQTETEVEVAKRLAREFQSDPQLTTGIERVERLFADANSPGSLRLREYRRDNPSVPSIDLDWFVPELRRLLTGS